MDDNELKELVAGLAIAQSKTDQQLARMDRQLAEISVKIEKLTKMYAWFGYNHLTITGGADSASLVRGYHIYRATVTGDAGFVNTDDASHIGTIFDSRDVGVTNTYDDHDVNYGSEYHYWTTSFNDYESAWSAALTGRS